jgi:ribosomal protein L35
MKTNKSYTKRLRVTKKGKIIARVPGQCHFNAKVSGRGNQYKKRAVESTLVMTASDKSRFLPSSK